MATHGYQRTYKQMNISKKILQNHQGPQQVKQENVVRTNGRYLRMYTDEMSAPLCQGVVGEHDEGWYVLSCYY